MNCIIVNWGIYMIINEDKLNFEFDGDKFNAIKFDDTNFYRNYFNKLPESKGVDILAKSDNELLFIEIKDCLGHESENLWRTGVNNSQISQCKNENKRLESFDIEISKKVAMTISCLVGAYTRLSTCQSAQELNEYVGAIQSSKIKKLNMKIYIILFLEGNFNSDPKRKSMIMKSISDSINKKLKWLNCKVLVVDMNTYNQKFFTVTRI